MFYLTRISIGLNLEHTGPDGLVVCKVLTDVVKIDVKELNHTNMWYDTSHIHVIEFFENANNYELTKYKPTHPTCSAPYIGSTYQF